MRAAEALEAGVGEVEAKVKVRAAEEVAPKVVAEVVKVVNPENKEPA